MFVLSGCTTVADQGPFIRHPYIRYRRNGKFDWKCPLILTKKLLLAKGRRLKEGKIPAGSHPIDYRQRTSYRAIERKVENIKGISIVCPTIEFTYKDAFTIVAGRSPSVMKRPQLPACRH